MLKRGRLIAILTIFLIVCSGVVYGTRSCELSNLKQDLQLYPVREGMELASEADILAIEKGLIGNVADFRRRTARVVNNKLHTDFFSSIDDFEEKQRLLKELIKDQDDVTHFFNSGMDLQPQRPVFNYVIDEDFNFRYGVKYGDIYARSNLVEAGHVLLGRNNPVYAGGQIAFDEVGDLIMFSSSTGHYAPIDIIPELKLFDAQVEAVVPKYLDIYGVDTSKLKFTGGEGIKAR